MSKLIIIGLTGLNVLILCGGFFAESEQDFNLYNDQEIMLEANGHSHEGYFKATKPIIRSAEASEIRASRAKRQQPTGMVSPLTETQSCSIPFCYHDGVCYNVTGLTVDPLYCLCRNKYVGVRCERQVFVVARPSNACGINPCFFGATCVYVDDQMKCICTPGFTGDLCATDVDECDDVYMCQRSGTCTNFVGSYLCQCMMGWTGARCEVSLHSCQSDPEFCYNGGVCVLPNRCDCPESWKGHRCEIDVDECATNPCRNKGKCLNYPGGFMCDCDDDRVGDYCEYDKVYITPKIFGTPDLTTDTVFSDKVYAMWNGPLRGYQVTFYNNSLLNFRGRYGHNATYQREILADLRGPDSSTVPDPTLLEEDPAIGPLHSKETFASIRAEWKGNRIFFLEFTTTFGMVYSHGFSNFHYPYQPSHPAFKQDRGSLLYVYHDYHNGLAFLAGTFDSSGITSLKPALFY